MIILIIVIAIAIIMGFVVNSKKEEKIIIKESKKKIIPDPNLVSSDKFFDFLESADQNVIDDLYGKSFFNEINDHILKKAFIYRWRNSNFSRDYYQEMIDRRNNPIKKKPRTSEEIYLDMLNDPREDGYFNTPVYEEYVLYNLFEITGVHIGNRYEIIKDSLLENEILLEKEDDNNFDKKAVKILIGKKKVGYVSSTKTTIVRRIMSHPYKAVLHNYDDSDGYKSAYFALYMKKR